MIERVDDGDLRIAGEAHGLGAYRSWIRQVLGARDRSLLITEWPWNQAENLDDVEGEDDSVGDQGRRGMLDGFGFANFLRQGGDQCSLAFNGGANCRR